jgi:hypothetical protein
MAVKMVKRHKSPRVDLIPAEFFTSSNTRTATHFEIYGFTHSIWSVVKLALCYMLGQCKQTNFYPLFFC